MRRPQGYLEITGNGPTIPRDTFSCVHCNRIVVLQLPGNPIIGAGASVDLGGFCLKCMKNLCGPCADLGVCVPFEKRLQQQELRKR